jgi:hypothetical protein
MPSEILAASGHNVHSIPDVAWKEHLAQATHNPMSFMTLLHRRIRELVVRELPRRARPLSPAWIAKELGTSLIETERAIEELEARLFFLVRNRQGDVAWAFPVTAERTPHALRFSNGDRIFGA